MDVFGILLEVMKLEHQLFVTKRNSVLNRFCGVYRAPNPCLFPPPDLCLSSNPIAWHPQDRTVMPLLSIMIYIYHDLSRSILICDGL